MAIHPNAGNDQHGDSAANNTEPATGTASITVGFLGNNGLSPLGPNPPAVYPKRPNGSG